MIRIIMIIAQLLFVLGMHAQTQKELRDSVSAMVMQIEEHPEDVMLRMRKAALNIELDQWDYALEEYTAVLELRPDYLTARYYRAFVNQHLGRYSFARVDYETVLKSEPLNRQSLIGLVLTNLGDGHNTEAFDGANRLVEIYPTYAEVYNVRAEVEEKLKMPLAAIDDMRKAIELEEKSLQGIHKDTLVPDDDMVTYQLKLYELLMANGKKSEAKKCLNYLSAHGISKALLQEKK